MPTFFCVLAIVFILREVLTAKCGSNMRRSQHGCKDLVPIFKTESIVSDILKKRRKLTTRHIEELAKFFHISPAAFFPIS